MEIFLSANWPDKIKEKKSLRDGWGEALAELAKIKKDIVVVCADLTSSTRLSLFKDKFPSRFFQVGVAEQNMVGLAAGLALAGKVPFAASFAVFCPGRCLDQIRVAVCLNNLAVKLVGSHAGLSHPKDGPTAQATEDLAIMRSLPNMKVVYPADYNQMKHAVTKIYEEKGPVYLRVTREPTGLFINPKAEFIIGKAQVLLLGTSLTIVSAGPLLGPVLLAAQILNKEGISCEVINLHTIKPIDTETIINSVKKTNLLLTVEDHQIFGGLGSAVAEAISEYPVKIKMMGLKNCFAKTARDYETLLKYFHLTAEDIVVQAKHLIENN